MVEVPAAALAIDLFEAAFLSIGSNDLIQYVTATSRDSGALAPLQDPRVGALLGMTQRELLKEMRFLSSDGSNFGGARAVVAVAGEIWWARPVVWIAGWPRVMRALDAGYKWVAARRGCSGATCEVKS